jgi:hypothetical protein
MTPLALVFILAMTSYALASGGLPFVGAGTTGARSGRTW